VERVVHGFNRSAFARNQPVVPGVLQVVDRWGFRPYFEEIAVVANVARKKFRWIVLIAALACGGLALILPGQARAATTQPRIPWSKAGPGWSLVEYSLGTAGEPAKPGPTTLYLISPSGQRYTLDRWSPKGGIPALLGWSGDKTRALLLTGSGKLEQLTLATGKVSRFSLAGQADAVGYTRPTGQQIIGTTLTKSGNTMIGRYSLTGRLVKELTVTSNGAGVISAADGATLVAATSRGVELISNAGGVIRSLPVPGAAASTCQPIRWWSAGAVLATCGSSNTANPAPRLWVVPVNGARPAALTPQRSSQSRDLGDLDAWRISGGTYLQAAGPCGTVQIFRQAPDGSISLITPAGTTGNDVIGTVYGPRMLLNAQTGCPGSRSLLWYDPRTKAEQWLLRTPGTEIGVISAVPYYTRENAQ
jgi:hypothetical protein